MNRLAMLVLLGFAMAALPLQTADAAKKYKVTEVADGGTITGRVLAGDAKADTEAFLIAKDPEVCGTGQREVKWVRIAGDALLDVVVYLEKVPAGKPFPDQTKQVVIDQKGCSFSPFLGVVANKGSLVAVNSDPVTHNIHTYELIGKARRTVINVSQSEQGSKFTKKIKLRKGVAMKVECDVHNFMHGWVFVARNPYFARVDDNGGFVIADVPPGKYVVKAWHGKLGERKATVEVAAGGKTEVSFSY
ncbi:MAG: hypothetical protein ACE5H8_05600 [Alphaproteobacteria bacterium]